MFLEATSRPWKWKNSCARRYFNIHFVLAEVVCECVHFVPSEVTFQIFCPFRIFWYFPVRRKYPSSQLNH